MSDCIIEGVVAEIYVKIFKFDGTDQGGFQGVHVQDQTIRDIEKVNAFYSSPLKEDDKRSTFYSSVSESEDEEYVEEEEDTSDDDEEYARGYEDTSDDDDEAKEFRTNARIRGEIHQAHLNIVEV